MNTRARRLTAAALLTSLAACTASSPKVGSSPAAPTPTQFVITIRRTNFQIKYVLQGRSENGAAVHLTSNPQLSFLPSVPLNSHVVQGETVGRTIVVPSVRLSLRSHSNGGLGESVLAVLEALTGPVVAPVTGVLALTSDTAVVKAPGLDIVVPLLPVQYLRYLSIRFSGSATIETVVGRRDVPCVTLWVEPSGPSGGDLHCRLPSYVETAAGFDAQVHLVSTLYENVVVVPNVYIGFSAQTGRPYVVVKEDGQDEQIQITTGVTDGVLTVVTSSVPVGASLVPIQGG